MRRSEPMLGLVKKPTDEINVPKIARQRHSTIRTCADPLHELSGCAVFGQAG
jgi:hypothetical protein